jgi:acyl-coenzyme A thioesterase 13
MNSMVEHYKKFIGQYVSTAPSPFSNWLKGKILDIQEDGITLEFVVREEMTNPVKMLHGGMIAAIMDDMIGMTIYVTGVKNFYASVNLHVDFISNVRVGTSVIAETKMIKKGQKVILCECNMYGPEKTLMARGTSNLVIAEGTAYTHP